MAHYLRKTAATCKIVGLQASWRL